MPTWRALIALGPLLLASACEREPAAPAALSNEAYLWDTRWEPAVATAALQGSAVFSAYRVFAADVGRDGSVAWIGVDLAALERSQQPVTAVVRLAPDGLPDPGALAGRMLELAQAWRSAGVRLGGVEFDRAGDRSSLPAYAEWLRAVRERWPAAWTLSISESPDWRAAAALPALLAQVDATVLRWDRVDAKFDLGAARRAIAARAALSPRPFRLALPAYAAAAPEGNVGASGAAAAPALRLVPEDAAALLRAERATHPAALTGFAWSRLPAGAQGEAWPLTILRGIAAGGSLRAVLQISFDSDDTGAHDLVLANVGTVDAAVPPVLVVAAFGCDDARAQQGYRLERSGDDWRFVATAGATIPAGSQRTIGWLRCSEVLGMKVEDAR